MARRSIAQSVVTPALVVVAALLLAPLVRTVTVSLTLATDRTWPFSLERPGLADRWVVASTSSNLRQTARGSGPAR